MAAGTAALSMRGVRRAYQTGPQLLQVLKGVDLDIVPGEWVAILGASGSGKSTLLNIVGLLDQPDAGTYLLAGRDVSHLDDRSRARVRNLDIGMVFQRFNLLPRTSALENVATPLLYARCGATERSTRALDALAQVRLADHAHHDSSELSGGQMQRVAIARALVNDPAVLLADEPTGNLDGESGTEILRLFSHLRDAGRTIVMITHDLDVAAHADRRLVLAGGVLRPRDRGSPS
jgi:putative ABC transport system ATP-binding protein